MALDALREACADLRRSADAPFPSRIVHLPLSWDDPATREAIDRYMHGVRADAPWCPWNIEFIRRINGLDTVDDVQRIVFDASYLVLGLGDVYLGAPVATPLDPRHRLVTTKYNPARTWTAENSVGIGGAYLCIYGMEGPGGYQFVGRTVQVWNRDALGPHFDEPWLLPHVRPDPLASGRGRRAARPAGAAGRRASCRSRIEDTTFRLGDHERFLAAKAESIDAFRTTQQAAFAAERQAWADAGEFDDLEASRDGRRHAREAERASRRWGVTAVGDRRDRRRWRAIAADGRDGDLDHAGRARGGALAAAPERSTTGWRRGSDLPLAGTDVGGEGQHRRRRPAHHRGCPSYAYEPTADAPAVGACSRAGAVVIGKTNLDQFATGLVGTRSPYGACPNAHWPGLVSGGSSSGSAVAVAPGMVDLALGTDTAGSGRVPAAANGIVGLKPTRGRISAGGRRARLPVARLRLGVRPDRRRRRRWPRHRRRPARRRSVAATRPSPPPALDRPLRIGFARAGDLTFDGDPTGPARHAGAVTALLDARPAPRSCPSTCGRSWSGRSALRRIVRRRALRGGRRVRRRPTRPTSTRSSADHLRRGRRRGWQVFRDQTELARLSPDDRTDVGGVDVLVVPTVPRMPTPAEVAADPIGVNSMLGTYTNFVNLLDLAALTVPVGPVDAHRATAEPDAHRPGMVGLDPRRRRPPAP